MLRAGKTQGFRIYAACGCNTGLRRSNNEDNFYFAGDYLNSENDGMGSILTWSGDMSDVSGEFFAVYDGMGGGQYGEIASFTAAESTARMLDDYVLREGYDVEDSLSEMCEALNEEIFEASAGLDADSMGSTLAGLFFSRGMVWCCNVGDSKCYRLRDGELRQLSLDHTVVKPNTGRRKPYLTQFLGVDPREMRIRPSVFKHGVLAGDQYLICSDGLSDLVTWEQITEILLSGSDEEEKVQTLIVNALKKGGKDNVTVIVCRIC